MVTDEWRLTEHSVDVAMMRGRMWLVEAAHSLERARHGERMYELILGTMAFVQAVHRLRQCVAMAAKYATRDGVADHFVIALKRFDSAVPGVKQVRDALEHSDEYLMGVGDAQQQGHRSKRLRDERQSRDWAFVPEYEDGDMERPVVTVGPHVIALVSALKAAERFGMISTEGRKSRRHLCRVAGRPRPPLSAPRHSTRGGTEFTRRAPDLPRPQYGKRSFVVGQFVARLHLDQPASQPRTAPAPVARSRRTPRLWALTRPTVILLRYDAHAFGSSRCGRGSKDGRRHAPPSAPRARRAAATGGCWNVQ